MPVIINELVLSTLKKEMHFCLGNYLFYVEIKAKVTNWKYVLKKLLW